MPRKPDPDRMPHPGRTSAERRASSPFAPTASSIMSLLSGIERHADGAPAAAAFRSALRRKGAEAGQAGGQQALDALAQAVTASDPDRADARTAILRAAWGELLPASGGKARA